MVYGKQGGRHPDPGLGAICARCGEPREAHGGPKKLGICPGQSGLSGRRFSLRDEDKPQRIEPAPASSPVRALRLDLDLWHRFGAVADPDRSTVLRAFVRWYLREGDLPRRPRAGITRTAEGDRGSSPPHSPA